MPRKLVPRYRRGIRDHIGHLINAPCCAGIENFIISEFSSFALAGGGCIKGRDREPQTE